MSEACMFATLCAQIQHVVVITTIHAHDDPGVVSMTAHADDNSWFMVFMQSHALERPPAVVMTSCEPM